MKHLPIKFLAVAAVATLVYLICGAVYFAKMKQGSANVVSMLGKMRRSLLEFQNDHDSFPATFKEAGLEPSDVTDRISGQSFLYFPKAPSNGVVLLQPKPYRTIPWPFGTLHQYRMLTDGSIQDGYAAP